MNKQDFLNTGDLSPLELAQLVDQAARLKKGRVFGRLEGKTLGLVFFNPSLRTRVSFGVAMQQLGGQVIDLDVGHGAWAIETRDGVVMDGDCPEHLREAAAVLSRYVDVLGVRAFGEGKCWPDDRTDSVLEGFARHASVPVINLESAVWHPCQALADTLTWRELGLEAGSPMVLTWTYHPRALPMAVPNSVVLAAAQFGARLSVLRPPEFALDEELVAQAANVAVASGGSLQETDDRTCLKGARVVYAKSWGSLQAYGLAEAETALRAGYRDWQVTEEWMSQTARGSFMHCLPVRRNVAVSDGVLDSDASAVVQQAENRLHVQKALLLKLLGATP